MYAGAQRVRNREQSGINSFLYTHQAASTPRTSAGHVDIDQIAQHDPGRLLLTDTAVPHGGNDVLSYLDIAAPDETPAVDLLRELDLFSSQISKAELPSTWHSQVAPIAIKFWALRLSGETARQEYDGLRRHLSVILTRDRAMASSNPFDAQLTPGEDGYQLSWTTSAKQRLIAAGFQPVTSLRLAYDVVDQWKVSALPGPLLAHCLAAMANTDLHELVRRGGVRVLAPDGQQIVWQRLTA